MSHNMKFMLNDDKEAAAHVQNYEGRTAQCHIIGAFGEYFTRNLLSFIV